MHHLLRTASRARLAPTLRRVSTTTRLCRNKEAEDKCKKPSCSQTPREEFAVKPPSPTGCIELPLPPRPAGCKPLDPCAPPPPKRKYPWEQLLEITVTSALLIGLAVLYYKTWREDVERSQEELDNWQNELIEKTQELEDKKEELETIKKEKMAKEAEEDEENANLEEEGGDDGITKKGVKAKKGGKTVSNAEKEGEKDGITTEGDAAKKDDAAKKGDLEKKAAAAAPAK